MYYLLLETVQEAKYFKNRRDLYNSAANRVLNDSQSSSREKAMARYMKDHARHNHEVFKAHLRSLVHERNRPDEHEDFTEYYKHKIKSERLKKDIKDKTKEATEHRRNMFRFANNNDLKNFHNKTIKDEKRLSKTRKRTFTAPPKFQKGKGVFPGRGRNPRVRNDIGNIDNGCAVNALCHATGRHPKHVISAFTRQMDSETKPYPWKPDGGATHEHMQNAAEKLGHRMLEIPPDVLNKHYPPHAPIYTAGQLGKKYPNENIIATVRYIHTGTGERGSHVFNIKNGKVHDRSKIGDEDTPVQTAHQIIKRRRTR